jgi:3-dehydroquinate synthase
MRRHSSLHSEDLHTIIVNSTTPLTTRVDCGATVRRRVGDVMQQIGVEEKVLLLYQKSLPQVWLDNVRQSIEKEDFQVFVQCLPDGDEAKSLEQLISCWERLQYHAFTRNDCIVAIGGGAVSDLGGFCAATYLRGIKLVLLPTTLLSQVDASIGGKTGLNMPAGKNQLGSFYFPHSVIVDPEVLSTLSDRELKSGMGEIVKYACIEETIAESTDFKPGPRPLLEALSENFASGITFDNPFLAPLISICIRMKLAVVLADPFEGRLRRCLNLGHTIGHGLENVSNYRISHGEAVTIGTAFAYRLSVNRGLIAANEAAKVEELIKVLKLPYRMPPELDREKLIQAVVFDKKRSGTNIKFVLPERGVGKVNLDTSVSFEELSAFIKQDAGD